jgi:hypothetical protein
MEKSVLAHVTRGLVGYHVADLITMFLLAHGHVYLKLGRYLRAAELCVSLQQDYDIPKRCVACSNSENVLLL